MRTLRNHPDAAFFAATTILLAAGILVRLTRSDPFGADLADGLWAASAVLAFGLALGWVVAAARHRRSTVDVIALLALGGSLAVGEPLAAAVIAWMLATGRVLEEMAQHRASRELGLLVQRAPRTARRREEDQIVEIGVDDVVRGDVLVVGPGEVVPVDGHLVGPGVLDESALTGEALPVEREPGGQVRSGTVNAGSALSLVASAAAADSTYAQLLRLVEQAQASSAPFVRSADRIAAGFVPLTLALAGASWWLSGDAVRAVAVLVVATPCPLLLAAPIAFMSGLSRAARAGVVVKGGAALERLGAGRVLLFDKTGTLTEGRPRVVDVIAAEPELVDAEEVLRLAASLDQVSPHVLADAIVTAGRARGLPLELPEDVRERAGYGVEGLVGRRTVRLGRAGWVLGDSPGPWAARIRRRAGLEGSLSVYLAVDGRPAGGILLEDPVRTDAPRMMRALRRAGIQRVVLLTGDRADVAEAVGRIVGVDAVHAEHDPQEKLSVVLTESRNGATVMVGDGVNDAPALAAAGVGVALAARGATASSETADVVLTVDRVDALAVAIEVAHRSVRIARAAVVVGMGLSGLAMAVAAAGLLPPTAGAVLQEGIDVVAILIALQAVLPGPSRAVRLTPADSELVRTLRAEHTGVRPLVERVRTVSDAVAPGCDLQPVRDLLTRLEEQLLPHERAEERLLYPVMARVLGGDDPTGAMSRAHAEIEHQVGRLRRLLSELPPDGPADPADAVELQRLLYGLYAVLRLHNAQEDEGMFSLVTDMPQTASPAAI
ncbi:MAG TPA: heavy metal translocating P-type ATPase [Kineosporiaceae bacterium]|nr:heavy metal translocating P-type ATPase [Kineosporiaceae bacterium]